jgi:hypothetical protein
MNIQNGRISNMKRDMSRFYLIDAQCDVIKKRKQIRTRADVYHLINDIDQSKTMEISIFEDGEVKCNCKDYAFRCYKNNILCKHCCYLLIVGLKFKETDIIGRHIDISVYNGKKGSLLDKFKSKSNGPTISHIIGDDTDCQICLDILHQEEQLHQCQVCHKYFHMNCIIVWKEKSSFKNCPNCRSTIELNNTDLSANRIKQLVETT